MNEPKRILVTLRCEYCGRDLSREESVNLNPATGIVSCRPVVSYGSPRSSIDENFYVGRRTTMTSTCQFPPNKDHRGREVQ